MDIEKVGDYMKIAWIGTGVMGKSMLLHLGFLKGELLEQIDKNIIVLNFNSRLKKFIFPLISFLKKEKDLDILYSAFRWYNSISVIAKKISMNKTKIYASQHGFEKQNVIIKLL